MDIEIAYGPAAPGEGCTWPGCTNPGLCQSGNFGNQIVCSEHFTRTNGETGPEASARIRREWQESLRLWEEGSTFELSEEPQGFELRALLDRICPE